MATRRKLKAILHFRLRRRHPRHYRRGRLRRPLRPYVLGCVHLPIRFVSASGADVPPDGQGFGHDITALAAHLRGVARRDFDHSPTSFFRLVFGYLHELFPVGVVDAPGEGMILEHALDVQLFDRDNAVIVSIGPGDLAEKILALASYL